jgi:hypothetical protein
MKIDRARALMFVGLLAASGCVITTDDDDDDNDGNGEAGAPAKGGDTSTGGKTSSGGEAGAMGGSAGDGAAGEGTAGEGGEPGAVGGAGGSGGMAGAGDEAGSGGEPAASGGNNPSGGASGGTPSTGGAPGTGGTNTSGAGGEGGEGPLCDDSQGAPQGCADFEFPDSTCEGEALIQRALCDAAATNFKPRIAEEIELCIAGQSQEELCDPELTALCAEESILGSCPEDEEAVNACAEIVSVCDAVDDTACLLYLSAMTETGKDWMVACMEEGLTCDLQLCAGLP